ncbi:hypothetical protein HNQ92_000461 [Rhabdobacter roseus]|uniref:T9SS type A sorting domain-containing protein n=1 Tax=Rhabdobacter roseus TaxID=1655419 RepID=A0A840TQL6_9BACT|nr:T9SS type A sorting domain-containing protein [Rhabdobacter roseus]MBB5282340.1 hypothetical protein [Rhabdobacter roseus]
MNLSGMKHPYTLSIRLTALVLVLSAGLLATGAWAQATYFEQRFYGTGPFMSPTPDATQFDSIYALSPAVYRIPPGEGYLEFERTQTGPGTGRFVRSTDFSPSPKNMYYQVEFDVPESSVSATTAGYFWVGRNFIKGNAAIPPDNDLFAKFSFNLLTNDNFQFRITGTGAKNSGIYNRRVLITWVMNNDVQPLPYLTPLGGYDTLAPKSYDLWINGTNFLRNWPRISSQEVPLTDIAFRFTGGVGRVQLSNILIREVAGILPVTFTYFKAQPLGTQVDLAWETAWEKNSQEFVIQRSTDLKEFGDIGRLAAAGESDGKRQYTFTDETPAAGANYYRLRQVDQDGTYAYSKVIDATVRPNAPALLVSPNPASSDLIRLRAYATDVSSLRLTNLLGQEISFKAQATGGDYIEIKPSQPLPTGVYLLSLHQNGLQQHTKVLIR